ncbi:hypothetical protein [Brassicibacter mesophilus]|uniref:hypothetical protein n=1 Tax=Brassicibacter mesophilus TaxID=745119 RepID=UPI003D1F458C
MRKIKKFALITCIIFLTAFIFSKTPLYYSFRSYAVMYPYSYLHKVNSILYKKDINFYIPGGNSTSKPDWYPFVMTFNDDEGFSNFTNRDLSFTVLYSFGHLETLKGCSAYYNPNSEYYSSFYGGYIIHDNENPDNMYGFKSNGKIDTDMLTLVPKYDQTVLVLPSIGCAKNKIVFDTHIDNIEENIKYIGLDGWTKVDSTITTNSPMHKYNNKYSGYIQYGKPNKAYYPKDDFPAVTLKGRIYAKYIDKYNSTFVLYVMAPSSKIVEECDREFLSKSIIK